jgi:hypothetical protein
VVKTKEREGYKKNCRLKVFISYRPSTKRGEAAKSSESKSTAARQKFKLLNMDAQPIEVTDGSTPIKSYNGYYPATDWAAWHVESSRIMRELAIGADAGTTKTSPQLYEDKRRMWNEMPHDSYLTMVKDERRWVLLHHATHRHATSFGARAKSWNNKVLMFTGDVVQTQAPQAVFLPSFLLATVQQEVVIHPLNQQLLNFHTGNNLEIQEPVEDNLPTTMPERIGTVHAVYLAAHLVPMSMGTRRTLREALMGVYTALSKLGDLEAFKSLLDWLRMAVTRDGALAMERASGPTAPIIENRLHEQLIQLVKQDLLGWEQIETSASREVARSPNSNLEKVMAQFLLHQQPRGRRR